jgi:hypothetical protein
VQVEAVLADGFRHGSALVAKTDETDPGGRRRDVHVSSSFFPWFE